MPLFSLMIRKFIEKHILCRLLRRKKNSGHPNTQTSKETPGCQEHDFYAKAMIS